MYVVCMSGMCATVLRTNSYYIHTSCFIQLYHITGGTCYMYSIFLNLHELKVTLFFLLIFGTQQCNTPQYPLLWSNISGG
jgi:hypothetical protein